MAIAVGFLVAVVVGALAKWVILTALIWIMIKIQKLCYNVLGLWATTAAAVLVTFIPFVGPYVAYPVLVFGLWKCTRADIAPDIIFTVAIAKALLFCVNLFLLGAMMGSLRPDFKATQETEPTNKPSSFLVAQARTLTRLRTALKSAVSNRTEQAGEEIEKPATEKSLFSLNRSEGSHPAGDALTLRGISYQATNTTAMIEVGGQIYSMVAGETNRVRTSAGSAILRCEAVSTETAVVWLDGQRYALRIDDISIRPSTRKPAPAGQTSGKKSQRRSEPLK